MKQQGFTLLEVTVALAIAAVALVVLMGRLGASADIQRDLSMQALALSTGVNLLEAQRLMPGLPTSETHGEERAAGVTLQWRSNIKKTMVDGFVRQNMQVTVPGQAPVHLFLYRAMP